MLLQKLWQAYRPYEKVLSVFLLGVLGIGMIWGLIAILFEPAPTTIDDDTYSEGLIGDVSTLNPLFADLGRDENRDISRLIFAGLTRYNPSEQRFEPGLATYTINDDVTEYTFTLKKDLKWHDGKDVTVDDVLFTYNNLVKSPDFKNTLLKAQFANVELQKVDDETVKFTLPRPNSFFLADAMVGILPQHVYQNVPVGNLGVEIVPELLVGTGPYQFDNLVNDDHGYQVITLEANKDYYLGKPEIANLRFIVAPHPEVLLTVQDQVRTMPKFDQSYTDRLLNRFDSQSYRLPQYTALFLNQDNPILAEERMRKVLKNAFDKNFLATELPDKQIIGGPFFMFEEIAEIPERYLQPLKEELYTYGWRLEDDDVRYNEAGQKLRFIMLRKLQSDPQKQEDSDIVTNHIVESAAELGIEISVVTADGDDFSGRLANKAYDILLAGHDFAYNLDTFGLWHSSLAVPDSLNFANYRSTAADEILLALRQTSDADEREDKLIELNTLLKAEAPAIFLYTQQFIFVFDNSVKNRTILGDYATIADRFYDIHQWELQ